ncbi:purine-binding chemotaxis protein CheW [bacterium]|nr:purine-binding chemotaxis protein CheW [bacterium]
MSNPETINKNETTEIRQIEQTEKYLTFELSKEVYGLEILKVHEIIGLLHVTRVPRMPEYVRGVINLRGKVIPVIDLRLKFGLEAGIDTELTCIIVVQVTGHSQSVTMGIIVDEVSEVLDIDRNQIEDTPNFGANVNTDFILGLGKVEKGVVLLLDVDQVLSDTTMDAVISKVPNNENDIPETIEAEME